MMPRLAVKFRPKRFAIGMLILVVLPFAALPAIHLIGKLGDIGDAIAWDMLVAAVFYFYLPARLFGAPHFTTGIGAGPADPFGFLQTALFYGIIALMLSFSRDRSRTN
jgi:hypothetical protein